LTKLSESGEEVKMEVDKMTTMPNEVLHGILKNVDITDIAK